mgnify:CR=1 FL=1
MIYVYEMGFPIDDFGAMIRFSEWYAKAVELKSKDEGEEFMDHPITIRNLLRRLLRSLARKHTYWEGDIRGNELYIGSIPNDEDFDQQYFIALQQENNGGCYIVSQIEFPHLRPCEAVDLGNKPVTQAIQEKIDIILDKFAPCRDSDAEVF